MASPSGHTNVTEAGAHRAPVQPGAHVRSRTSNYRTLGVGRVQKVKESQCKFEFNPSVFSRPPFRSQNYILRLDKVEVSPPPRKKKLDTFILRFV